MDQKCLLNFVLSKNFSTLKYVFVFFFIFICIISVAAMVYYTNMSKKNSLEVSGFENVTAQPENRVLLNKNL
jgi:uncharacterized protein YpmB